MSYFEQFPPLIYNGFAIKDITLKNKLVKQIMEKPFSYSPYFVTDFDRPDSLAYKFYGDAELHWIILLANNIVSVYDDWPVSDLVLRQSIISNFGEAGLNEVIYYLDQNGELMDPRYLNSGQLVTPVTRYEYQMRFNDTKRIIIIPKKELVNDIVNQHINKIAVNPNGSN